MVLPLESGRRELSAEQWAELGAYSSPFSGTGVEFLPMGAKPEELEIALHEVGFLPHRPHWNYSQVFSPFWRLYYDLKPGHKVVFPEKEVALGPDRLVLIPDHQLFQTAGTIARPKFWYSFSYARRIAALPGMVPAGRMGEVHGALTALGYKPSEFDAVLAKLDDSHPVTDLIKQALAALRRK